MKIVPTELPGVVIICPDIFPDARGYFLETYHQDKYKQAGLDITFIQDNRSRSQKGTLRGMHAQLLHPQGKLVQVVGRHLTLHPN